jgi:lipoprotein-anchoring transpeptidase ErfK/SrfK
LKSVARAALVLAVIALALCASVVATATADGLAAPGLTLRAAPEVVKYGESVRLQIHLGVPGARVQLSRVYAGEDTPVHLQAVVADASGDAGLTDAPLHSAVYTAAFAGDAVWAAASAETSVTVRAALSLSVSAGTRVDAGDEVTVKVGVAGGPAATPLEIQERIGENGPWRALATVRPDEQGQARWVWRPRSLGRHRLRAVLAASASSPVATSGVRSVRVYDPHDRYKVPSSYPHLIVVDLSDYRLFYYEHGWVVRAFDCVLGRPSLPTPRGHFKIYAKDPAMYGPYGPRRLRYRGLYAIHGTNEPWLLSRWPRDYSHGCTRLANANIVWLFDRVHVGTPVWNVP